MTINQPTAADDAVMDAVLGRVPVPDRLEPGSSLWGFGGVHGGLTLALLVRAVQQKAGPLRPASVSATFVKPLRGSFDISLNRVHAGRSAQFWTAGANAGGGQTVVAADVILSGTSASREAIALRKPPAPPPEDCPPFRVPPSLVPFSTRTEIRPVGVNRPFGGGAEAELTAWLRLTADDEAPDVARFVMLMDSLAPSYAAILDGPVPIPTVVLSVSPKPALGKTDSPWVLLRARTVACSEDGWVDEHLDAWSPEGLYLGHGYQRRLVVSQEPAVFTAPS